MSDVVDEAIKDLGVGEDPPHSNMGPCSRFFLEGEEPGAWCARAVRTWFARAGIPLPGNKWKIPSVTELQKALVEAHAWIPVEWARNNSSIPRRGDLVLLNEKGTSDIGKVGHHVGLVESFDPFTLKVNSIDGNWGDEVKRVSRHLNSSEMWGFGRWSVRPLA